ncbi:MAG: hypothetical protein WC657_09135, partial [Candidatus Paceibacterota bacterium]
MARTKPVMEEIAEIRNKLGGIDATNSAVKKLGDRLAELEAQLKRKGANASGYDSASNTTYASAQYALSEGVEPAIDGTGAFMSGYPITFGTIPLNLGVCKSGKGTFGADTSGNVRSGSDVSAAATTAWIVFSIDQTYNSEDMGAGDMLLGDNSTSKANILWDVSAGQLKFRSGTTVGAYVDTDGTLVSTDANIGGWDIDADEIKKLTANVGIILDSANRIIKVGDTSSVHIQIDGANKAIKSSNYAAGASGFNIAADTGNAEFNNIIARGLIKTAVFEKDTISAIGGTQLVLPADVLATDMTALDASTLTIAGNETFAVGDILRMKDGTDDEWFEVTVITSAPTYTVTRDKAAAYAANTNPVWKKGQAVVNYMKSGDGGISMVAGATPKVSCFTPAGAPWTT